MGRWLSVLARLIVLAVGSSLGREQLRLGTSAANYCVHAAVNVITAREVRSFPRCSSFPDPGDSGPPARGSGVIPARLEG